MISQQQIDARNRFNLLCNEVEGHLTRLLSEWQLEKAWKISGYGGPVAKLQKQFDSYCESHGYNIPADQRPENYESIWITLHRPVSSIQVTIKAYGLSDTIRLVNANEDGIVYEIFDCVKRRIDYTLEQVQETIKQAKELEEQARSLRWEVHEFSR